MTEQLPPHIVKLFTKDGRPYYVNHDDNTTSWTPPVIEPPSYFDVATPESTLPPEPPSFDEVVTNPSPVSTSPTHYTAVATNNNHNNNHNSVSQEPQQQRENYSVVPNTTNKSENEDNNDNNQKKTKLNIQNKEMFSYFVILGMMLLISTVTLFVIFFTGETAPKVFTPYVITVSGNITDCVTGAPVPFVHITGGNQSTYSDETGFYELEFIPPISIRTIPPTAIQPAPVVNQFTIMNATIEGYAPQVISVQVKNAARYSKPILLNPFTHITAFNLTTGFALNYDNGYNGTGNVTLEGHPTHLTSTYVFRFAVLRPKSGPGVLQADEVGELSQSTALQSAGMFYWDILDDQGNYFALPDPFILLIGSGEVSYTIEVDASTTDPSKFWEFDPLTGVWGNPTDMASTSVSTVVDGRRLEGPFESLAEARRQGYWNNDRGVRIKCVTGKMLNSFTGEPCPGAYIQGGEDDGDGLFSSDITSSDGEFCLEGGLLVSLYGVGLFGGLNWLGLETANDGQCGSNTCRDMGNLLVSDHVCEGHIPPEPTLAPTGFISPPSRML